MILYEYALSSDNSIISINKIDKHNKGCFKCMECEGELIARTGVVNKWHFAHKNIVNCSGEGYLHKLAKRVFFENKALQIINNKEFTFSPLNNNKGNLAEVFDIWEYEKTIDKYRADILLSSSQHNYKIMIEIKVTHASSRDKINSNIPIIEISIRDQVDINYLKDGKLHLLQIDYYNLLVIKSIWNQKKPDNLITFEHMDVLTHKINCKYFVYEQNKEYPVYCKYYKEPVRINPACVLCS